MRIAIMVITTLSLFGKQNWRLFPVHRCDKANPIIAPNGESSFFCPIRMEMVKWEQGHTFNPSAIVRNNKVYLLYRAEDDSGKGVGKHTSRIGLAVSDNGVHFSRYPKPVLYPTYDEQFEFEYPGGCEDPRVVEREDGSYILTYTQWNQKHYSLAIATSTTLESWEKHGFAFKNHMERCRSKAGAILCKRVGNRLITARINDKYWMYWGDDDIYLATSDDCVNWEPLLDADGKPKVILQKRGDLFDSNHIEPGPSPILTSEGIILIYNARNSVGNGDPDLPPDIYTSGQALMDKDDPTFCLARTRTPFFLPECDYEKSGQYKHGTVFIEGLAYFKRKYYLYYGTADSCIGAAYSLKKIH